MFNESKTVKDPLISSSGKIYSARAVAALLAVIFPEHVDKHALLCGGKMRKGKNHVREKRKLS